ncbi:disease resistance protein like [Capsicum galapagoense]
MEILFNAVGGFVVEVVKFVSKCIYPKIENIVRFSSKIENLRKEMEELARFRDDVKAKVEVAVREGYKPKPDVVKWFEDVQKLENEWEAMQESIAAAQTLTNKCCPKCSLRSEVSAQAKNIRDQFCKLKEVGQNFGSNLVVENYRMKKVEHIPGPSIEGQPAATRNLNELLRLLEDDKVYTIGVWGMGGVGKTTLVKNLNNELLKLDASRSKLSFGAVIWVTVPKPPTDIRKVQAQIASRLNLQVDNEESVDSIAGKIYRRLKEETSFLLILDDVWEAIDLDDVGVPQPEGPARSKVIITSRLLDVCRQMRTNIEMRVTTLKEDESWQLFVKNAGDVANLEHIQPLAKEIARECGGLPLAITSIGTSMRGKTRVELWEGVLKSLRMSEPRSKVVEDRVYKVIKLSYDSLERQDIQSCFLYCSLYPAAIPLDDLIHCWWAEGFLGEHDTYVEAYNRGITIVESLEDACLVETHWTVSVKMCDVVLDVARWIANTSGDEHTSVFQAGIGLTEISRIKITTSVKRISFIHNKIECLPDCFMECPETTSLLLQDNEPLEVIPHEFLLAFPALRVLNLSGTSIRALPSSINSLYHLRALILHNCICLKELPPIGNLCNLQVLDSEGTELRCLPQGLDKLTNLKLLNMLDSYLGPTSFDEISSLHKLTSLFITLDSSSIFNRDYSWMSTLQRFHIEVGNTPTHVRLNKSRRIICISECEFFRNGELSTMLQFASELYLHECMDLRKFIAYNSFDGLKSLHIEIYSCDFGPSEEGSGQFDPLPNLERLSLISVDNLKSVSDFSQLLGLRFSKLRQLEIQFCASLTYLFNVGGAFSVPNHLEDISITSCPQLVELSVQCSSPQAAHVISEVPRIRKLYLKNLPKLEMLGEPRSMWEHLEEREVINCGRIEHQKLPLSIPDTNIKGIKGLSEWWNQLTISESHDSEISSEERSKLATKSSCFLYCALYPAAITTEDLINCWWAEGFLGEHDSYDEAYNEGVEMVESLKDACMLEAHKKDFLKMHDVVRDFAIWKANTSGNELDSIIQTGVELAEISHIKASSSVRRISLVSNEIECLPDCFTKCPETTSLLLQDNEPLEKIPHEFLLAFPALRVLNLSDTGIGALPSSINSLCQLRALVLQRCPWLKELPPIGKLCNLQLLDCDNTRLCCLPHGMDKLTNLKVLNLPVAELKNISKGFFLKLPSIEMLDMLDREMPNLRPLSLIDEISSLHNLTSLFIRLDSSSIFNRDHTWMSRLKRFHIEVGNTPTRVQINKSRRMISVSKCEIFSNGELSGMLQFASDLYLHKCMGFRKLIAYNRFDGLKSLRIERCSCDFGHPGGSPQFDPLPNLELISLISVDNLKCVSDFSKLLGLRLSKLRQLEIHFCASLTCLFTVGRDFSLPKQLEDISITFCPELVQLLVQRSPTKATHVNSETPRVQKLVLRNLPKFGSLGEPQSMWEHLKEHEVINCDGIEHKKLPSSIQTTNVKVKRGVLEWFYLRTVSDLKESKGRNQRDSVWS